MLQIILTISAVALSSNAIQATRKALTIQLQAFRVAAVAPTRRVLLVRQDCGCGCCRGQSSLMQLVVVGLVHASCWLCRVKGSHVIFGHW